MEAPALSSADRVRAVLNLLGSARQLLGEAAAPLERWEERLLQLGGEGDERLRAAVAGTVKSGKTTLVNALIGGDHLKRGAGIVTSLVTRVRPGPALKATLGLKGWADVNREATDCALFLGAGEEGRAIDLRQPRDRELLERALAELGEEAFGEGGFFEKNAALLKAYLQGYERVAPLLGDEGRDLEFSGADFEKHRDFAGHDALAAYVDDLILDIPGLPFQGSYEIGDCQGYDSPNPRHMEKVQDYLMGCHLVVYVVSSRVGLREADLRFVRDVKALGLLESTVVVLNADLGEHASAEDLTALRDRVASELGSLRGSMPIFTFSGLRALFTSLQERGAALSKKDELLLEVWKESPASAVDEYGAFHAYLGAQLGEGRKERLAATMDATARQVAASARSLLDGVMNLAGRQAQSLTAGEQSFQEARAQAQKSLRSFESALVGLAAPLKKDLFRKVDGAFHAYGGKFSDDLLDYVKRIEPPVKGADVSDMKKLFRQMARVYQEMRAALHRYKVEVVNAKAVAEIRSLWGEASGALADAAAPTAALLVKTVEVYRAEAAALGIDLPPLEIPHLDPSIGKKGIPLFSAVTFSAVESTSDKVLSFADKWTRKVTTGWVSKLFGGRKKGSFRESLLAEGAEAARDLLADEALSNLMHYNEVLKYQVLGVSLDELAKAWAKAYRERIEALILDLDSLAQRIRRAGAEKEDLLPRLQGILRDLEPLAT